MVFSISIKVVENWISFQKTSISNQLKFWEASYGQNTKQVQKITQIQHHLQFSFKISNGDQHQICSSLYNRLIPSHSFRRKFLKNKLDRETDTYCESFQKCSKNVTIFSSNLKRIFDLEKVEILFFSISENVVDDWISF